MGLLVDGVWVDQWYDTKSTGGRFMRQASQELGHCRWNSGADSSGRVQGGTWTHRTLIFRKLKRLEHMISVSVVHWLMAENGWTFADGSGVVPDPIHGARFLHEVYTRAQPNYTGRVTVPVLWDKLTDTLVNNESSETIRMFNSAFDACGAAPDDFYPGV